MGVRLSRRKEVVYASISAIVLAALFWPTNFQAMSLPSADAQAYERVIDARDRVNSNFDRVQDTVNENAADNIETSQNQVFEVFNNVLQRLASIFGI